MLPSIGSDIPWKTANVRSREKARLNLRNRLGYKWHVTRMVEHPNSLSWVRVHLWMQMSELVELSPSSWDVTRHPNSLSWVRVHLWMRTPELVELSPSSLRGGLHDFLITYEALMCKLSVYPSCIPMCSTGEISSEMEEHLRCKRCFGKCCEMDTLDRYVLNPRVDNRYNNDKVVRWWMMFRNMIYVLVIPC